MRKYAVFVVILFLWTALKAQTYTLTGTEATITNALAGCIYNGTIPVGDRPIITKLKVSGTIDARDFRIIRDELTSMTSLDAGEVLVAAYTGMEGTIYGTNRIYSADVFPVNALVNRGNISSVVFPSSIIRIANGALAETGIKAVNTLPSTLLSIGDGAFSYCDNLQEVILPPNLTHIQGKAFVGVTLLKNITIPSKVTTLGGDAFYACTSLSHIYMESSSPEDINLEFTLCFDTDTRLKAVLHIPVGTRSRYTSIPSWRSFSKIEDDYEDVLVYGNTAIIPACRAGFIYEGGISDVLIKNITKLTIHGSIDARDLKLIRDKMLALNTLDLTDASFAAYTGTNGTFPGGSQNYPANVFPAYALYGRTSISTVLFPMYNMTGVATYACFGSGISSTATLPASVTTIGDAAFSNCSNLKNAVLPPNLTTIGIKAFYASQGISSIIIPASVSYIGDGAFDRCLYLSTVFLDSNNPNSVTINRSYFDPYTVNYGTLYVPTGTSLAYRSSSWSIFVNIQEGVLRPRVDRGTVTGTTATTATVDVPIINMGSFTPVEYGIVWSKSGVPTIDLPTRKKIGSTMLPLSYQAVIQGLTPGEYYNIRTYVSNLAGTSYGSQFGLAPPPTTSSPIAIIEGNQAFIYNSVPGFLYGGGISTLLASSITSLTISGSIDARDLRIIRDNFTSLNYLNLGEASIASYTGSEGTLYGSYRTYDANSFPINALSGSPLYYINLPSYLTALEEDAFNSCESLSTIRIPSGVTSIGPYAFMGCRNLYEVTIPSTVTAIAGYAFYNNTRLYIINAYPSTAPNLTYSSEVFTYVPTTCVLRIPEGSLSSYMTANKWRDFSRIVEGFIPPTIVTLPETNKTATSATLNATISDLGDASPVRYGFVWSSTYNPTYNLSSKWESNTPATGSFSTNITGLIPSTTYYVRSFIVSNANTTEAGLVYGEDRSFTTTPTQLTLTTPPVVARKIVDNTTAATLTSIGTISGILPADIPNLSVTATASYSSPTIGTGKTITVHYTLSGSAASRYLAPQDYILTNGVIYKGLLLRVYLEGLWDSQQGEMRKCQDVDPSSQELIDMFPEHIVDKLIIELHNATYSPVAYTMEEQSLLSDGSVNSDGMTAIAIEPTITGSYYLTVKSRNHLDATSATMVSFNNDITTYNFLNDESAYGAGLSLPPTKLIDGSRMLYAGNVINETPDYQEINMEDLYTVFNNRSAQTNDYGYSKYDLDGNGDVDIVDVYLVFHNRDALFFAP